MSDGRVRNGGRIQFERKTLIPTLAVLTFGLTALSAVLGLESLVPVIFVVGFFLLVPLVAILGDSLPMVGSGTDERPGDAATDPVETLRERYADGELTDAEFERRLERLVETEDVEAGRTRDATERTLERE